MADEILVLEWFDHDQIRAQVKGVVVRGDKAVAACLTDHDAHQIAALLRFQSAMTPEMWNTVNLDGNRPMPDEIRTPSDAVAAALDTLRQELQQP